MGQQLCEAALIGDAAKVGTLLSTPGAQSFINYQDVHGVTPLFVAAANGHETVTEQLIEARCNVDLQGGEVWVHIAPLRGQKWSCGRHETAHCCAL